MVSVFEVALVALVAGCATGIGAIPTLFSQQISHRTYDGALGLAAGIMFGAAVFALIVPGLELGGVWEVMAGVALGALFLLVANKLLPHVHLHPGGRREHGLETGTDYEETDSIRKAVLIGGAITIHNVPEGLAIGIAFASGHEAVGFALAIVIAIQNVPDGFAMAVPAAQAGVSRWRTVLYTTLSGGVPEPIAAVLGFALVAFVTGLFPLAAGFAAGAMLAVISREMIPASHGHGHADLATVTFITGFTIMLFVDTVLVV